MSVKIKGQYCSNLRCELIHENSGSVIYTDAPVDNNGKGEKFSPTDLLAAGLASCMLIIIGIRADHKNILIGRPKIAIEKTMKAKPRAIAKIRIELIFDVLIKEEEKNYLEKEARNCPVALSLSKEIEQEMVFKYVV